MAGLEARTDNPRAKARDWFRGKPTGNRPICVLGVPSYVFLFSFGGVLFPSILIGFFLGGAGGSSFHLMPINPSLADLPCTNLRGKSAGRRRTLVMWSLLLLRVLFCLRVGFQGNQRKPCIYYSKSFWGYPILRQTHVHGDLCPAIEGVHSYGPSCDSFSANPN